MKLKAFGPTNRDVSAIGQGTWRIDKGDRTAALAALRRGLDLGMNHVDTAEMYGDAEEIVAEALAARRDRLYLVSKVLPQNASRQGTIAACERTLKRLRTDRLDCYLLHWRGSHPLGETVAAFEQLKREGKILAWGVSNFDVADLEEICQISAPSIPACNQVLYHLEERATEHAVIPWCEDRGIAIVAYSPLGQGKLAERNHRGRRVLAEVAEAYQATPAEIALAFLVRRGSAFAIPKASKLEHVEENAKAGDLRLTESAVARIDNAFPLGPRASRLPML
jgi:diketogulonate reductase-like aldo/keto reductase